MNLCFGSFIAGTMLCGAMPANANNSMESNYASLPSYNGEDLELLVNNSGTHFRLWSPQSTAVRVLIYDTDRNTSAIDTLEMTKAEQGTWKASVAEKLYGKSTTMENGLMKHPECGLKL